METFYLFLLAGMIFINIYNFPASKLADRECNEEDVLVLKKWDPETKEYTDRVLEKEVTYYFI